jgi:hypothetical protein
LKYIASVYSLNAKGNSVEDLTLRDNRYLYTMKRVAIMAQKGQFVFSPIVHCHVMANTYNMPKDYTYYQDNDRHFIEVSDGVIVLKMPG